MNALTAIRHSVAPELNFLLTEPPFERPDGLDFGWYCREHAFCTAVIAALRGLDYQVVLGDFLVDVPGMSRLTSLTTDVYHAWCSLDGTDVLDFSLHFRWLWDRPQLAEPIWRFGRNGIFEILSLPQSANPSEGLGVCPSVGYIQRQVIEASALDLLVDPQVLLVSSEAADISCRVALHAFNVLCGKDRALRRTMSQAEGLARLSERHPDAQAQLIDLMRPKG